GRAGVVRGRAGSRGGEPLSERPAGGRRREAGPRPHGAAPDPRTADPGDARGTGGAGAQPRFRVPGVGDATVEPGALWPSAVGNGARGDGGAAGARARRGARATARSGARVGAALGGGTPTRAGRSAARDPAWILGAPSRSPGGRCGDV